jgi:CheY-like chemotaxis protein
MSTLEYVCVFVRASGDRLRAAERLVLALPKLLEQGALEVDLRYQAKDKVLAINVRSRGEGFSQAERDRLVFWSARAGGRAMAAERISTEDRQKLAAYLGKPTLAQLALPIASLVDGSAQLFTDAGAMPDRRRGAAERPQLVMDVGGPGWDGVRWSAQRQELFVAAPYSPPVGDEIPLLVRIPGTERPLEARAVVALVRPAASAAPGAPAGYTLRLTAPPPQLTAALEKSTLGTSADDTRAAPRFQVNAPVKLTPAEPAPAPAAAGAPAPPLQAVAPAGTTARALIEYATDQELEADFIENLSQGGAFVRTSAPAKVGTIMELELKLPNGADLHTRAVVAFANANGVGVRFQLDAEAEGVLANAMATISARPRRALVVDDDEIVCRMIADALRDRGFEVLVAANATEGLSVLSEELLALDLLVTDVVMPGMSGEDFVRLIRKAGGEEDLAIVCVTGQADGEGLEKRLEAAGADAVLDKALGPDLIAQAADAVLERKRLVAQGR